jgi:hypothetical protein
MSYTAETFLGIARDAASTAYRTRALANKADGRAYAKALLKAAAFGGKIYEAHADKSDRVLYTVGAALVACRAAIAAIDGQGDLDTLDAALDDVTKAAELARDLD